MNNPKMSIFYVEDKRLDREHTTALLKHYAEPIFGIPAEQLDIQSAGNIEETRKWLRERPGEYRLVILDLLIYCTRQQEEEYQREGRRLQLTGPIEDLPGMDLLSDIREWQPDACIVVSTSYAYEGQFQNAVKALRDWGVDDFIPKGVSWDDFMLRLRNALARRSQHEQLARERTRLRLRLLTQFGRVLWEDFSSMLSQHAARLVQTAEDIEIGGVERIEQAPTELRDLAASARAELGRLAARIPQGNDTREPVNVAQIIRDLREPLELPVYGLKLPEAPINTYPDDLCVALLEVFYNALEAMDTRPVPNRRRLWIELAPDPANKEVKVTIRHNGAGFPDEVINKTAGREAEGPKTPLWFQIVRRMMEHLGGTARPSNWSDQEESGGQVVLTIPELK
jgi:DNA-binding NarL/FixJ family response regulator